MSDSALPPRDRDARAAEGDVLERNVDSLLANAGDPPRLSDAARQRLRAQLLAHAASSAKAAPRRWGLGLALGGAALAAAAATAVVVLRPSPAARVEHAAGTHELPDGSLAELGPDAHVEVLGPRRVRVRGAAIFDVVPGKERFVVETARGTVEALGTRFLVEASADRTTAAVLRGQVALRAVKHEAAMVLGAGEGGQVERDAAPARHAVPRLSHLTSWAKTLRESARGAPEGVRRGTLLARDPNFPDSSETALPMKQLTVDVVVDHRVARVAIDHTFHNAAGATLEGMYRFALPPDAALQRLAMYVGDELMEAAVVDRMRARRVYEELVLRRVDPALLEYTGVGRVQLRVYPLPPRSDKRIALAYTQSLPQLYDTWSLTVPLPKIDVPVDDVRFAIRLADCANCEVASPSHQVAVARRGEDLEVSYQAQGARVGDSLLLNVRQHRDRPSIARHRDGADEYWLVRAPGVLPEAVEAQGAARRHWVILQDASASRGVLERRAQAELIGALVREFDEDDRVSVMAFDLAPRTVLPFSRVMDVTPKALAEALRGDQGGLGATDLGRALDAATAALRQDGATTPMIVYVGDGVVTAGDRKVDALRARIAGKATFVGVGVGDGIDTLVLGALATATSGMVTTFDLSDDLRWRAFDLVATLRTARATGLTAAFVDQDGRRLDGAMLRSPQLSDGEELEIVAKLPADATPAAIEVTGEAEGAPWRQRIELAGAASSQRDAGFAPRLWAQREIDRLMSAKHEPVPQAECATKTCPSAAELREARDEALRKQIVELGKRFFLLSRHTSLIVLENDAMYAQYGVTKGQGKTWAPYALPAKLPTKPAAPIAAPAEPPRGELVRAPWQPFRELPGLFDEREHGLVELGWFSDRFAHRHRGWGIAPVELRLGAGAGGWVERDLDAEPATEVNKRDTRAAPEAKAASMDKTEDGTDDGFAAADAMQAGRAAATGAAAEAPSRSRRASSSSSWYYGDVGGPSWGTVGTLGADHLVRMPGTALLTDLSALAPALALDELARARRALRTVAPVTAGSAADGVDPRAAAALEAARAALRPGAYRWGDVELVVDAEQRLGWRRTLPTGVVETAGFDGKRLVRQYRELDLATTAELPGSDQLALQATMLPLWIAPVESYARRFTVSLRADGAITLTPRPEPGTTAGAPALVLVFEQQRLRRITDGYDHVLAEVTWNGDQPIAAMMRGAPLAVSYQPAAIANAATEALGAPVSVQLSAPLRHPTIAAAALAAASPGTPAWRSALHHALASRAVAGDRAEVTALLRQLLAAGAPSPGELVLASDGLGGLTTAELARATAGDHPVAQYLRFARRAARQVRWADAPQLPGALGAMVGYLHASDLIGAKQLDEALDRATALPAEAPLWRAMLARELSLAMPHRKVTPDRLAPLLAAQGPLAANQVRLQIAELYLSSRSPAERELGVARFGELLESLELSALPPAPQMPAWYVLTQGRGEGYAASVFAKWRERVMAQGNLQHVLAFASALPPEREAELGAALTRAAELAKDDVRALAAVAVTAMTRGRAPWAWSTLSAKLDDGAPAMVDRIAEQIASAADRPLSAIEVLERAMRTEQAGRSSFDAAKLRADYQRLLRYATQGSSSFWRSTKGDAVAKAQQLAAQWRELDPDGPADRALAAVYLNVGMTDEAVRLLSSNIDRDPMSGATWAELANELQRVGKVEESLPYWHEAMILDQTNPSWRVRKAQALISLGKKSEAKAILEEIARRRWNVRWEWEAYGARELLRDLNRER